MAAVTAMAVVTRVATTTLFAVTAAVCYRMLVPLLCTVRCTTYCAMAARCGAESPGGDVSGPEAVGTVRFLGSGASSGPDFAAYKTESLKNPSRPVCY